MIKKLFETIKNLFSKKPEHCAITVVKVGGITLDEDEVGEDEVGGFMLD